MSLLSRGERRERAKYSDGTPVPDGARPSILRVEITGRMTNTPRTPLSDVRANALIMRSLRAGNARSGFYYVNDGEDAGSVSAVVPDASFLRVVG